MMKADMNILGSLEKIWHPTTWSRLFIFYMSHLQLKPWTL